MIGLYEKKYETKKILKIKENDAEGKISESGGDKHKFFLRGLTSVEYY